MSPLLPLLLLACAPGKLTLDDGEDTGAGDSADTGDTDTGDSGETAETDTGDSGDSGDSGETDTAPDGPPVSDVNAWIDADVVTIVHVAWTQDEAVDGAWLEFRHDGEEWEVSPERPGDAGAHEELVLGVPAEAAVEVRVVNRQGAETLGSEVLAITTGTLPEGLGAEPTIVRWDPTLAATDRYLLGSIDVGDGWYYGPFYVFVLDREGRYVWYHAVPDDRLAVYAKPAWSGDHLWFDGSTQYVFDDRVHPQLTRMTLDGRYLEETVIDEYGFAVEEREDGAWLYEHRASGDYSLHARLPDGTDEELWVCNDYMTSIGQRRAQCNPNTIVWNRARDSVFWSMYYIDTVVEVDLATAAVTKHFGQLPGGWAFDPESAVVDYQHYVNWDDTAGTIMASTHVVDRANVQVCNEYEVDEANATLTLAWSYESPDYYAHYGGECHRHPGGNTIVGYGTDGAVVEVTPAQDVAWEVAWSRARNTHLVGHMTLLDDLYALNEGPE